MQSFYFLLSIDSISHTNDEIRETFTLTSCEARSVVAPGLLRCRLWLRCPPRTNICAMKIDDISVSGCFSVVLMRHRFSWLFQLSESPQQTKPTREARYKIRAWVDSERVGRGVGAHPRRLRGGRARAVRRHARRVRRGGWRWRRATRTWINSRCESLYLILLKSFYFPNYCYIYFYNQYLLISVE